MNLILFGFKGAGKTTLGKIIAEKLKRPFIDTDDLIAPDCRRLYLEVGEKQFRTLEQNAISSLKNVKNAVIALGGGVLLEKKNLELLQQIGTLVYLEAPKELLKERMFAKPPPFITNEFDFETMYSERVALFEKIKAKKINTEQSIEQIVREISGK